MSQPCDGAILPGEDAARGGSLAAVAPAPRDVAGLRLLLPRCSALDGLDAPVATAFARAVEALRAAGATVAEVDAPALTRAQSLFGGGGLAGAEAYHIHREVRPLH